MAGRAARPGAAAARNRHGDPRPPAAPAYLDAAIRAEAARVHQAPRSQRNATLYTAAVALGQLVAGGVNTPGFGRDAAEITAKDPAGQLEPDVDSSKSS